MRGRDAAEEDIVRLSWPATSKEASNLNNTPLFISTIFNENSVVFDTIADRSKLIY
jgi:hypothetical protein